MKSGVIAFVMLLMLVAKAELAGAQCGCTHIIPLNPAVYVVDATTFKAIDGTIGVKPGSKVCFQSGTRPDLLLKNFKGTPEKPILLTNMCDGQVKISANPGTGRLLYIGNSQYLKVSGAANPAVQYGIEIAIGVQGIDFRDLSSDCELEFAYIHDLGYSAINAKTDATCDPATWRGNFTMRNISVHDNYVKNTGGEAIYIGESHYHSTFPVVCGGVTTQQLEHDVIGVKVYNNRFENIGRDAIQVGSTLRDCTIHDNYIKGFGVTNEYGQQSGIQINPGTNTECYNNVIDTGTGFGIFAGGQGGSHIYNNIIRNALSGGIICQDYDPVDASGFVFSNNTIINCNDYGIYMLSERTGNNVFVNNILVAGGKTAQPAYQHIKLNSGKVKWTASNNIMTSNIADLKFVNAAAGDFHLGAGSPAINAGKDMQANGVTFDLDNKGRPKGASFDIGAYEVQPATAVSNAGPDKTITLPTSSVTLTGSGTSPTGITGYTWTLKSGSPVTIVNGSTSTATINGLAEGRYVFELNVTDASSFDFDDVVVVVLPATANQNPKVSIGADQTVTLPTNTLALTGVATDADGSIVSYAWNKVSGPAVTMTNTDKPTVNLSGLVQGIYIFYVSVADNKGATAGDIIYVTVNPATANKLPAVNAGADKSIFLPTTSVTLNGTATDADGTIASYLWTKTSGGAATLGGATTKDLSLTGLALGNYTFRLTATDNQGGTGFDEVDVKVLAGNQSPTALAGADQSITLPTNSVSLVGAGTDPDGSIATYSWVKVSGPSAGSLSISGTTTLNVNGMAQGTYVFGLTVTDNQGAQGYDEVTVLVSVAPVPNQAPRAIAGGNVSLSLPTNSTSLFGSGFDPDGSIVKYSWTKASGGVATLNNADKPTVTISGLVQGQYTFRLTVTDDKGATGEDIAIVTVSNASVNVAPVADAGPDRTIKLPVSTASLNGSGSDADGNITSYLWEKVSGPAATIGTPATASTNISNLVEGVYVFRLTVTDDKGAINTDETTVTVVPVAGNLPPVVSAGADKTLFLPTNSITIDATVSDDGTIATYAWTKLEGPAATLTNPNQEDLNVTGLVQGDYSFSLTVTDNLGVSSFDVVRVSVLPGNFAPPVVDAGPDVDVILPTNSVTLTATASSPNGAITTIKWTKTLGPAATLGVDNALTLNVTNMAQGSFVFKVTVTDVAGKSVSDNVTVNVKPTPPNQPPVVSAGFSQVVITPASTASLIGTAVDNEGTVTSTLWKQIQGPNNATLSGASSLTLNVSGLVVGQYIFRLEATDNEGLKGSADAIVFVSDPSGPGNEKPNQLPIAHAGDDVTVILPQNSVTLTGVGLDPDGFVNAYSWEQIDGPASTMEATNQVLSLTDLTEGQYTYRLTVTDTARATAFDDVTVFVLVKENEIPLYFSPNNDGVGDTWIFRNITNYQACKLQVFARSGQVVYEASPYQNNWDGTYNGKFLADGDYYYDIKCDDGSKYAGAVRIIR